MSPKDKKERSRNGEKNQQAATTTAANTVLSAAPHERSDAVVGEGALRRRPAAIMVEIKRIAHLV